MSFQTITQYSFCNTFESHTLLILKLKECDFQYDTVDCYQTSDRDAVIHLQNIFIQD